MLLILNSLMAILLFTAPVSLATPLECGPVEIKKMVNNKAETVQARACTNNKRTILISENCKDKKCKALNFDADLVSKKDLSGQLGKPGFKLCRKLSGSPSLLEFKVNKKWYALDECRFKSDNSFINTSELLERFYPQG